MTSPKIDLDYLNARLGELLNLPSPTGYTDEAVWALCRELERLGLRVPVRPDGAFYIYTDIREYSQDSDAFSQQLLHEAGVAAVPGRDFGTAHAPYTLRLSYATGMDRLQEAISRLGQFLGR